MYDLRKIPLKYDLGIWKHIVSYFPGTLELLPNVPELLPRKPVDTSNVYF